MSDYGFDTLAVHAGAQPDPATGARSTPIYQTTSFVFESSDHAAALFNLQVFGNIYTRIMNPTTAVLEERIAALEGGRVGLALASGHAAQLIAFHTLMEPGCEILAARQLYGGSLNQLSQSFAKFGWIAKFVDAADPENFRKELTDKTRCIFIESIANPGGFLTDIEAIAGVAHSAGIPLIVDNTFATPYLTRPFEWGADIVVHSATKYLNGHGNSIAGLLVDGGKFDWGQNNKFSTLTEPCPSYHGLRFWENFGDMAFGVAARVLGLRDLGPSLSPMNAWLTLNGIETLPLRMQKHCANALEIAQWLKRHPKVAWVNYAGLEDDACYNLHRTYCPKGAGAVFAFGVSGGYDAGVALVNNVRLISHLANVGDTRSLIIHPASTTHRQLDDNRKRAAGAGPEVIRISVGIEDAKDIIADLDQALNAGAD